MNAASFNLHMSKVNPNSSYYTFTSGGHALWFLNTTFLLSAVPPGDPENPGVLYPVNVLCTFEEKGTPKTMSVTSTMLLKTQTIGS